MKKLLTFLIIGALFCGPMFAQEQVPGWFTSGWLTRSISGDSVTGVIKADGTVPLTADWANPAFSISALNLTATPTPSAELITFDNTFGSGTGWSWSTNKWAHASGTTALTSAWTPTASNQYWITIAITHAGTGGVTIAIDGISYPQITSTQTVTYYVKAGTTGAITFTPTTAWTGSVDSCSAKSQTGGAVTFESGTVRGGQMLFQQGSFAYPPLACAQAITTGINFNSSPSIDFALSGIRVAMIDSNGFTMTSSGIRLGNGKALLNSFATGEITQGTAAVAPVDQTIKGPNGFGSDKPGGMFTLQGGASTGTGNGGGVRIQTSTASTTSSTVNTEFTRYLAVGKVVTLTDAGATDVVSFAVVAGDVVGGMIVYTIDVTDNDASDRQVESGTVIVCGLQDEANWHTNISEVSTQALESGALATTWTIDTATANTLKITCLADSDLTTPVIKLRYQVFLNSPIVGTVL